MLAELSAMGTLLTVNLLFASVALAVGFAAGVWFFGSTDTANRNATDSNRSKEIELKRVAERAVMASQRIQDLAKGMVSDVGVHASKVEAITADLQTVSDDDPDSSVDVFAAISKIVEANSQLQQRLATAEQQIEAQAAELQSYETEARTDSLTGLANRRAFDDEIQRRFNEWERRRTPFTLLILDIDHFKRFNDTHGHQAGDELLRKVGHVLAKAARQMDVPCRYGGEEFAVVLASSNIQEARIAAERFRKAIECSVIKFEGNQLSVTASFGVAQVGDQDDTMRLIRRADEALYKAKEAGRNCSYWHDFDQCLPVIAGPTAGTEVADAPNGSSRSLIDGLATRSVFLDVLHRRVTESHRFGIPLSLMHLRVSDYRGIQREYGKSIGRLTLESVAGFTQETLREMDMLAQLDEGEFVALLPGSTLSEAGQIARRLQNTAANCVIPLKDQKVQLRISHGIAQLQPNETALAVLTRASHEDEAADADRPLASV